MIRLHATVVVWLVAFSSATFLPRIHAATWHVAQTTAANDRHAGTPAAPFRTINRAAQAAMPGDTILVHKGIYREWVKPPRGGTGADKMITYQAAAGETVVISGAELLSPAWIQVMPGKENYAWFLKAPIPESIFEPNPRMPMKEGKPGIYNPFRTPLSGNPYRDPATRFATQDMAKYQKHLVIGDVYTRAGKPIKQVRSIEEVKMNPGTWTVAEQDGRLYLFVNFMVWTKGAVELTVRHQCFAPVIRGLGYIKVSGFTIEKAATLMPWPQAGMLSTRTGHHWIIENNTIRYGAGIGVDAGGEVTACYEYILKNQDINEGPWADKRQMPVYEKAHQAPAEECNEIEANAVSFGNSIRNNTIESNGHSGIMAVKTDDLVIENNVIEYNNRRFLMPIETPEIHWEEVGGIKLHMTRRAQIRNNLVRNNYGAMGIWLDNNNDAARISGNLVLGNWYGLYLEINAGPSILVDNNILAFNDLDGISGLDSTNLRIINNLSAYNGRWGCMVNYAGMRGQFWTRQFCRPQNCEVKNNLFVGNQYGALRFAAPRDDKDNNRIEGNLIAKGDKCQVAPDLVDKLKSGEMIAFAQKKLVAANVPKAEWPDFTTWQGSDPWNRGECNFISFNAIMNGQGNHEVGFGQLKVSEMIDSFRFRRPDIGPTAFHFTSLSPEYRLQFPWNDITSFRATASGDVDRDYFGNPYTVVTRPGPFQGQSEEWLTLWPKQPRGKALP